MILIHNYSVKDVRKGEAAGHPFRGNQHSGGGSGGSPYTKDPMVAAEGQRAAIEYAQESLSYREAGDFASDEDGNDFVGAQSSLKFASKQLDKVGSGGEKTDKELLGKSDQAASAAAKSLKNCDDPELKAIGRELQRSLDAAPILNDRS